MIDTINRLATLDPQSQKERERCFRVMVEPLNKLEINLLFSLLKRRKLGVSSHANYYTEQALFYLMWEKKPMSKPNQSHRKIILSHFNIYALEKVSKQ